MAYLSAALEKANLFGRYGKPSEPVKESQSKSELEKGNLYKMEAVFKYK